MATPFERCFEKVVGHEGGYTTDRNDKGNWTGGQVGAGQLKGTKYGISAASYPNLDIKNLTLHQAREIYERDYWRRTGCDAWDPTLALIVFDAAVNAGPDRAARWLQAAAGTTVDGAVGPMTRAAVTARSAADLRHEVHAQRILHTVSLPTWPTYKLGWARRLARLPSEAAEMEA